MGAAATAEGPASAAHPGAVVLSGRRAALVIGNSAYVRPGEKLANPCRDAQAIGELLRIELGFEVTAACDLGQLEMHHAVDEFAGRLDPQGVALFFYSGHAVEVDGQNYLLPVGHEARTQSDAELMGYRVSRIIDVMESRGAQLNIVLLDACRDNPLPSGRKGGGKGLARVDSRAGTIVGFATRAGATAEDGKGAHSPYAEALLQTLPVPGLSVTEMLNQVGYKTKAATGNRQEPWISLSAVPAVYLAGTGGSTGE
jgi:uncharacterized caspase-like protein